MKQIIVKEIPTTSRQAFKILDEMLSSDEIDAFLSLTKSEFTCTQHFGLGTWIRNNWIYSPDKESDEESKRRDACIKMLIAPMKNEPIVVDPDTISSGFLGKYYVHLKRRAQKTMVRVTNKKPCD